mmetsp:Transcript_26967/g.49954  ORF Transcript_26967/g.49954 Transcript_26967/m.49954 type:complete len:201 (-) Transcript_26967:159-761(-)
MNVPVQYRDAAGLFGCQCVLSCYHNAIDKAKAHFFGLARMMTGRAHQGNGLVGSRGSATDAITSSSRRGGTNSIYAPQKSTRSQFGRVKGFAAVVNIVSALARHGCEFRINEVLEPIKAIILGLAVRVKDLLLGGHFAPERFVDSINADVLFVTEPPSEIAQALVYHPQSLGHFDLVIAVHLIQVFGIVLGLDPIHGAML